MNASTPIRKSRQQQHFSTVGILIFTVKSGRFFFLSHFFLSSRKCIFNDFIEKLYRYVCCYTYHALTTTQIITWLQWKWKWIGVNFNMNNFFYATTNEEQEKNTITRVQWKTSVDIERPNGNDKTKFLCVGKK